MIESFSAYWREDAGCVDYLKSNGSWLVVTPSRSPEPLFGIETSETPIARIAVRNLPEFGLALAALSAAMVDCLRTANR